MYDVSFSTSNVRKTLFCWPQYDINYGFTILLMLILSQTLTLNLHQFYLKFHYRILSKCPPEAGEMIFHVM